MKEHVCIDLRHLDLEGAIACYVVDGAEPTIIDPGPTTTLGRHVSELDALGIGAYDLRHVLLTHIHLDHAGATGHLLEREVGDRKVGLVADAPQPDQPGRQAGDHEIVPQALHVVGVADVRRRAGDRVRGQDEPPEQDAEADDEVADHPSFSISSRLMRSAMP